VEINMTGTSIADAVARATAAAATAQAAAGGAALPATIPAGGAANAVVPHTPGKRMSLDDVENGSMSVDGYFKVKYEGLKVGDKPGLFETCIVEIVLPEVAVCKSVKYGNPAIYEKTYDEVRTAKGGRWDEAMARAKAADPSYKSDPYISADIPMKVLAPITDIKGVLLCEAGKKLGYSLSTTNLAAFKDFKRAVEAAGISLSATVVVEIGFAPRSNKNGNQWGTMTFKLIGEKDAEEAPPEEAAA
jgi:hypothetical protein